MIKVTRSTGGHSHASAVQPATRPRSSRASYANPSMRISDAERTEVADRLSPHYGEGGWTRTSSAADFTRP